jgi:hypothetical protein
MEYQDKIPEHCENFSTFWIDQPWLETNVLTELNVMNYFYNSLFYDKSCNNEKTKEDLHKLKFMRGLEYIPLLSHSIPSKGIFYIKKQFRTSDKKVIPIALYYIYYGRVYESPSLSKVINAKIRSTSFFLNESLTSLASHLEEQLKK